MNRVGIPTKEPGSWMSAVLDVGMEIAAHLPVRSVPEIATAAVVLLLCVAIADGLQRLRAQLLPWGVFPAVVLAAREIARVVAVLTAIALIAAVTPVMLLPLVPVSLLAAAVALGASVRRIAPDLLGGWSLRGSGELRPGEWVDVPPWHGTVEHLGWISTYLRDAAGRRIRVPNHHFVDRGWRSEPQRHPPAECDISVASPLGATTIRQTLTEIALMSPWRAPKAEVEVWRDPEYPSRWHIRTRLLARHHTTTFAEAIQEQADDALG